MIQPKGKANTIGKSRKKKKRKKINLKTQQRKRIRKWQMKTLAQYMKMKAGSFHILFS